MNAIWSTDYDYSTDKLYRRPCCPKCEVPIGKQEDGQYHCFSCQEVVSVTDPDMIQWLKDSEDEKIELSDCPRFDLGEIVYGCGGKNTVERHYYRNHVTKEWQFGWSICQKCGARTMV